MTARDLDPIVWAAAYAAEYRGQHEAGRLAGVDALTRHAPSCGIDLDRCCEIADAAVLALHSVPRGETPEIAKARAELARRCADRPDVLRYLGVDEGPAERGTVIKRRASPLTLPWYHGMPFANAYAMAASTPREALGGALKEALDRALPELREAASRAGERRVAVLLTGQANAAENGPWEWDEATGEWARPTMDGPATCVIDAPVGAP